MDACCTIIWQRGDDAFPAMKTTTTNSPDAGTKGSGAHGAERPAGQVVLVLQGGGALGAYQAGVYQALGEAGIEPDWVIGTSIGAINGAIIAGNPPELRLERLQTFWSRIGNSRLFDDSWTQSIIGNALAGMQTLTHGVPGFFQPNPPAIWNVHLPLGIEHAAFYTTEPLKATLVELDFRRPAVAQHRDRCDGDARRGRLEYERADT